MNVIMYYVPKIFELAVIPTRPSNVGDRDCRPTTYLPPLSQSALLTAGT
ncbi:hypothetical protein ACNKHT_18950 [Shigella flexneri]